MLTIDLARARAAWFVRQGLADASERDPAAVVRRTGWLRTLGGVDVYLALRSRMAGFERVTVDAAVREGRLRVAPAVRGCIYVVPAEDHALALRIAERLSERRIARDLAKVGVGADEIERAGEAVVEVLERGPLTTHQVRAALPDGIVRGLGEVGKKIGMSSTLPVTLRSLEFAGRIERVPVEDRLDHEQYGWRRVAVAPDRADRGAVPDDIGGLAVMLAERFFRVAGPATVDEFVNWSGLGKRDAQGAVKALGLVAVGIAGVAGEAFVPADEVDELASRRAVEGGVRLLSFADNYLSLRANAGALADAAHGDRFANSWGRGQKPLAASAYLHSRAVLEGDRLAGSWEWDPDAGAVVAVGFDALAGGRAAAWAAEAAGLTAFLRDEVGHARSTSIDSEGSQRERLALVVAGGRAGG